MPFVLLRVNEEVERRHAMAYSKYNVAIYIEAMLTGEREPRWVTN